MARPELADAEQTASTAVRVWLWSVWASVLGMVLVGGITRLTGSGLSMVEWHPLMGALPPLDEAAWRQVFDQYKRSPQFEQVNSWMTLSDFKRIFFWEYLHRLAGRLVGLLAFLPWLYLLLRGRLSASLARRTFAAIVLGGMQGVLGWYMVQSGLVDEPRVSHFRLAAHLLLAFGVGMWVLWVTLDATRSRRQDALSAGPVRAFVLAFIALLLLQTAYGAFMAGTRAGYYYGTFPDMAGHFGPGPFFRGESVLDDAVNSPSAIHYLHRLLGWLTFFFGIFLWFYVRRVDPRPAVRRAGAAVGALVFVQLNLGALTVIKRVAIPWAVAHQGMAYLLLSATIVLLHRAMGSGRDVDG